MYLLLQKHHSCPSVDFFSTLTNCSSCLLIIFTVLLDLAPESTVARNVQVVKRKKRNIIVGHSNVYRKCLRFLKNSPFFCFANVYVYIHALAMCVVTYRGQKRALDPWELESYR